MVGKLLEFPRQILSPRLQLEPRRAGCTKADHSANRVAYHWEKFRDQRKLKVCCWPSGGSSQASPVTPTSESRLTGVLNRASNSVS